MTGQSSHINMFFRQEVGRGVMIAPTCGQPLLRRGGGKRSQELLLGKVKQASLQLSRLWRLKPMGGDWPNGAFEGYEECCLGWSEASEAPLEPGSCVALFILDDWNKCSLGYLKSLNFKLFNWLLALFPHLLSPLPFHLWFAMIYSMAGSFLIKGDVNVLA